MNHFPFLAIKNIALYIDDSYYYEDYVAKKYILDYWFNSQSIINTNVNLNIFPKVVINIVCKYFDIDQFYKLREKYEYLDVREYCKDVKLPIGNEQSYIKYRISTRNPFFQKPEPSRLDWACHAGYLELVKYFYEEGYLPSFTTMETLTRSNNYGKDYFELVKYTYSIVKYFKGLDEGCAIINIINSKNPKVIRYLFDHILDRFIEGTMDYAKPAKPIKIFERIIDDNLVLNNRTLIGIRDIVGDVMGIYPTFRKLRYP